LQKEKKMNKPQQIDWKRHEYPNRKSDSYPIDQRIADLQSVIETQCSRGNYDTSEYMRGMANGLLLAWSIVVEPYGTEPQGPQSGLARVLRGGCWYDGARYLRSAYRGGYVPGGRFSFLGFRLVRTKAPSSLLPSEVKHETKD
jgi:hypothetical protein